MAVTVAEAVVLTAVTPEVPVATATLVWLVLRVNVRVKEALAPGASGPQFPISTSSIVFPGVPKSSVNVPDAGNKLPELVTTYKKVTGVGVPCIISQTLAVFVKEMWQFPLVTVNVQVPILPQASVAVAVTVVTPRGNTDPEACDNTGVNVPEQLSLAVTT